MLEELPRTLIMLQGLPKIANGRFCCAIFPLAESAPNCLCFSTTVQQSGITYHCPVAPRFSAAVLDRNFPVRLEHSTSYAPTVGPVKRHRQVLFALGMGFDACFRISIIYSAHDTPSKHVPRRG